VGLVTGGKDANIGGAEQGVPIVAPTEEAHTLGDAQLPGQGVELPAQWPIPSHPEIGPGLESQGLEQHVDRLGPVQPAERQQQGYIGRRVQSFARHRRRLPDRGEVGQVVRPRARPAPGHDMLDDARCDADQMVAAAVVFEVVESAQPRQTQKIAARKGDARPVHPGHHHMGLVNLGLAPQHGDRVEVEPTTEWQFDRLDSALPERHRAGQVPPNHHELVEIGPVQRQHQAEEEGFGAALARAGHDLHHPQRLAVEGHRFRVWSRMVGRIEYGFMHHLAVPAVRSVMARTL
jgi:hypothetical protein